MSQPKAEVSQGTAEANFLKEHHVLRAAAATIVRLGFRPPNAKALKSLGNLGRVQGLSEGSIIGTDLAYPDAASGGLVYEHANGGRWLGYDFKRPTELGDKRKQALPEQLAKGQLFGVMLDEVNGYDAGQKTPDSLLNLRNIDHLLRFTTASQESLVETGMLVPTTYREAYGEAGVYEQYAEDLDRRALTDQPIHAVTPKGNTLVLIFDGTSNASNNGPVDADRQLDRGMRIA
jgi:hypothetical protein